MLTEKEYNRTVAKNLRRIMHEKEKTQADMARDLKIGKTTISAWMNGVHIPRMDKIDMICRYLGCTRSNPHGVVCWNTLRSIRAKFHAKSFGTLHI